jgi:uncharacterized protein (TIGR02246 family)
MMSAWQSSQMALLVLITFMSLAPAHATDGTLAAKDQTAIQALLEQFRNGWLSGNADAVRSVFAKDAVLMPHHGVPPVVGIRAINEFWWPANSPKTTITRFTQTLDEIGGNGSIGYVRGRSEVAWSIETGKGNESWRTGGNFMALVRKQRDGNWLISHLIWDDPPNQRTD